MFVLRFVISLFAACVLVQLVDANAFAYRPPTDAPVIDDWRAPLTEYSAGNRGIDYGTDSGQAVNAAEDGMVSFVGQVGGTNYITIEHGDGLKSTYGGISTALVSVGETVSAGLRIAIAGSDRHFGVKNGEEYIDPNSLFGSQVHLVTLDAPVQSQSNPEVSGETAEWLVSALINTAYLD